MDFARRISVTLASALLLASGGTGSRPANAGAPEAEPLWPDYEPVSAEAPEMPFLLQAWLSQSPMPQEGAVGRFQARIYPGGREAGCEVLLLHYPSLKREEQFRICGGRVERARQVACALPAKDRNFERARAAVAQNAWATGLPSSQALGDYTLEALPIGYPDARGCRPVIERVRCDGLLADWRVQSVCRP